MRRYMDRMFTSIRQKIIVVFTVLIVLSGLGILLSSTAVFEKSSYARFETYVEDITKQTTNNLKNNITKLEDLSFELLSNSVIQTQLTLVNTHSLNEYELQKIRKRIVKEIEPEALYNSNIVSLSVISDSGEEFTVQKVAGREIAIAFEKQIIYNKNGTSIWGLVGVNHNICVQRAILSLKTMKPIGYVNIVCKRDYFGDIIEDTSKSYTNGSYVVDQEWKIMCSNNSKSVGQFFPIKLYNHNSSRTTYYNAIDSIDSYYYKGEIMSNGWTMITTIPVNEFDKDINQFGAITTLICLTAIVLSLLGCYLMTSQLTKPTEQLLESMKIFGSGDFTQRLKITSRDEIGQIGQEYNHMAENIEDLVESVLRMEIAQKQAEIESLKMQINPHFLYNTLDTISWMGTMRGNQEVSDMTIALGNLLRATIKNDSFVKVKEEMKSVRDYLFIQEYRFGDKINVQYEIQEETLEYVMPNFLLQPLIENAIIHGLEPKIEAGHLLVKIQIVSEMLYFCINDDGIGMTKEETDQLNKQCRSQDENHTIGLKNVYRRLQLIYGKDCSFSIESMKNQGMAISFTIPLEHSHI